MSIIEEYLPRLEQVLDLLLDAHENVEQTAQKMNEALKRKDIAEMQLLNSRYDAFIGRIEELEEKRLELCDEIAKGMERRHINLGIIIDSLPGDKRAKLSRCRSLLKEKIGKISRLNTSNYILLDASLQAIAKNVEIIAKSQDKFKGYGRNGALPPNKITRGMFNKIA